MKKILLSLAIAAGFTASAQDATSSEIAGNTFTDGNTGFQYSFNAQAGLSHDALNCSPNTSTAVWDVFGGAAASGDIGTDTTETGNGFLSYAIEAGSTGASNARQWGARFPVDASFDCGTAQGSNVGNFSAEANQVITARVRATTPVNIAIVVSTDDGGWTTHDAIFDTAVVAGDAQWTTVQFEIADSAWNGVGDLTKAIGWELWFTANQTLGAGEIHFDYITFGDAVSPNVSAQEVVVNGFNVFPNPATDLVNVRFDATSTSTVELMDVTGKIVESIVAQAGAVSTSFATANINAGVYFVNVRNANGSTTQRVIVK